MGPAPKGSNAEDNRRFTGLLPAFHCWDCNIYNSYTGIVKINTIPDSLECVVPGGAGDGQGEAVFGVTFCGVEWADDARLVGWGGPPNKSPRRSVVAAAEVGGWDEGHAQLMSPPSRPRRFTSSGGSGFAEGGSGLVGAVPAVVR